jgi:hypothetical protein
MTIPLVVILGAVAFGVIKWGKQKLSGIIVGVLFGLALASTVVGPPIIHAVQVASTTVLTAITGLV